MRLNIDILIMILQLLERKRDISAVMKTSKTLYATGLPILVAEYSEGGAMTTAMAYLKFLLVDPTRRIPMLRSLSLLVTTTWEEPDPATLRLQFYIAVKAILRASTQLADLKLGLFDNPAHSAFPVAMGRCLSLTYLELEGITCSKAADILSCIQTPLKSVTLHFAHRGSSTFNSTCFHMSEYTRNFTDSLETLAIYNNRWTLDESLAIQWPKMTSLSASFYPYGGSLSAKFPRLRNLIVRRPAFPAVIRPESAWSHLSSASLFYDYLSRGLPSCVVERLNLIGMVTKDAVPGLVHGLGLANPLELTITLDVGESSMEYTTRLWKAVPRLHCLTIRVAARGSYSASDVLVSIHTILPWFASFLTSVFFVRYIYHEPSPIFP